MNEDELTTLKAAARFMRINAVHQEDKDTAHELQAWIEREILKETEPTTPRMEFPE